MLTLGPVLGAKTMRAVAAVLVSILCAGCGQVADAQAKLIENLRVKDAIGEYETAGKSGNLLDQCVKAKLVASAYADAGDAADSQAWMARSQEDCRSAAVKLHAALPSARP